MIRPVWGLLPVTVLGPALACIAPRSMALLYVLSAIVFLALDIARNRKKPEGHKTLGAILGVIIVFGLSSYAWSISPGDTLTKTGQLILAFAPTIFLVSAVKRMSAQDLNSLALFMASGLALGLGVYFSEIITQFYLYDLFHGGFSQDSEDVRQNKAAVLLAFWLYACLPWFFYQSERMQKIAGFVAILLVMYATYESESSSALIILCGMPVLAFIVWLLQTRITLFLAFAVMALFALTAPLTARALYDHTPWLTSSAVPTSFKARIEIWNQAAQRIAERPMLGWGLDSSPVLPNRDEHSILPRHTHLLIAHLHPHNAPLQIWFELGGIGIAALSALFAFFYCGIRTMQGDNTQKYALFAWSGLFLYTLTIWGIWQSWFVATLCFMGVIIYAGTRVISARLPV